MDFFKNLQKNFFKFFDSVKKLEASWGAEKFGSDDLASLIDVDLKGAEIVSCLAVGFLFSKKKGSGTQKLVFLNEKLCIAQFNRRLFFWLGKLI